MCYQCDPRKYNPNGCASGFDPLPEGAEIQRMEPQVERLVLQAEKVGYLTANNQNIKTIVQQREEELDQTVKQLEETQRRLNYTKQDLNDVAKERDSALRRIPKKPKVTKKGKK